MCSCALFFYSWSAVGTELNCSLLRSTYMLFQTAEQFANAVPGHLELDPEFRKLHPNIPGPEENVDPFIVGGDEAIPHSRPYQVLLNFSLIASFVLSSLGGNLHTNIRNWIFFLWRLADQCTNSYHCSSLC